MGFAERYGRWALVTGAGQGIGAAFVADAGARGMSVVMVDRDAELLSARAAELVDRGVEVRSIVVDLAAPEACDALLAEVAPLDVGLVVNNAAMSSVGPFLDESLDAHLAMIDVNCRVPLTLAHTLLPPMVERGRGAMVFLSSLSAMRGTPITAGYAATKAWNLILAESLFEELRGTGVDVMAVLPGSVRTPGWLSALPQAGLGTSNVMDPTDVARESLDAIGTSPSFVPGEANRQSEAFLSSMERAAAVALMGDVMRAMFPPERAPDPSLSPRN